MKKFMIAALAAGMLTACSDSAVVEAPAGGGAQWGADGTGYVSLNISLPSSAVGRANDQFHDGLPSEYKVKDAVLVLFKGATEDAATFVVKCKEGSTLRIQRKFSLGYNRVGRIMDELEKNGIIGPQNGSRPREVLIHDETSLKELLNSIE